MYFDPLILSNHFCTYFINFRPFSTFLFTFFYINTFNCALDVDGGGAPSGDEVIVVLLFVRVVVVVVVVVVVFVVAVGY